MTTSMSEIAHNVMMARKNFGAPESMRMREAVKTTDMKDKVITIDEIVVMNKVKRDDDGNPIMTKDGQKEIYQPYVYVAFDGDKFFSTKSSILVEQLEALSGEQLVYYEKKEVPVKKAKGLTVKVGSEDVKYRDGKMYGQIIFKDAE